MADDRLRRVSEVAAALPQEYQPVDDAWSIVGPDRARTIGLGGSSLVIPALYRSHLKRAIKVFMPREDLRADLDMRHFLISYENELLRQSSLSHQNISKITDFSVIRVSGEDYPFIATEFIDGVDMNTFIRDPQVHGSQIMKILNDVLLGLAYLHSEGVMHCDIKQENVLVQYGQLPFAVIVDLGSSRNFPIPADEQENELVYFFTTPRYAISRLQLIVSNKTRNRIERGELRKFFPYQDLHSFGVILKDIFDEPEIASKMQRALGGTATEAIQHILKRLHSPRPGENYFQSANEIRASLDRVGKHSLAVLNVPELALAPGKGVVIPGGKGPRVHGTGRVDRIMSHPLFQRFHNLPQLDLLHWTLPGATHTRYVHAAHSYDLAREAVGHLLNNWQVRLEITPKDIETTLFSALLNQIGHYHFLHMFEDFIEGREADPLVHKARLLSDDELLDHILMPGHSDLGHALAAIKDERNRTLPQIIGSLGLDWADVRGRQRRPQTPLQGVLAALLSGPLDVEKLAYLRDDSRAAGLQFGSGLEGSPIFEAIVIPREEDWRREGGATGVALGITERAMSYLEYGVLTRYWNIQTAYWNRTNRAVQSMLKFQIACLIRAELFDFEAYIMDTLHMSADGALRWLDERFRFAQDDGAIDSSVVNPMSDLLQSRRVIYRRLITISGKSTIPGRDPDYRIYSRVRAQSPLMDEIVSKVVEGALAGVQPGLNVRPGEILVDLPRVARDDTRGNVLVYTDDGPELMGELFKISPNLHQHQQSFEQYVKRMRIFLHPRLYESLRETNSLDRAYAAGLEALRDSFAK